MMGIFSSIKAYIIGGVVVVFGLLAAVARYFYNKAKEQRRAKERAKRNLEAEKKRREKELDISDAKNRAERRRKENERAEKERIENDIRSDDWGDDRLDGVRDKD